MIKPEFMYNKNMLSSQAISIRNENNMNRTKKFIFSDNKIPSQTPLDPGIFLKWTFFLRLFYLKNTIFQSISIFNIFFLTH